MGYLAAPSMSKWCQVFLLAFWMAGSCSVWAIQRNGNSYELNIAISDRVAAFNDAQSKAALLQSIEKTMTEVSKLLFQATDYYFYFGTINILLPRSWTGLPNVTPANRLPNVTSTATVTYTNADMRLEETQNDLEQLVEAARTKHSKLCGQPGEYIILPPQFFTDVNGSTTRKYGDKAKVILHEFAHYRYGVFEEYGFPDEDYKDPTSKYPYYFVNKHGEPQLTGCYDQPIEGTFSDANGLSNCSTLNDHQTCRFKPNMNATSGPASSLMFWQFLPTVNKFCDSSNHDPTAPNKHNYWCRNRSIKSVMTRTADNTTAPRPQPLNPTQNTVPTFTYLVPVPQIVYVVLDTSSHTVETADAFDYIKNQLATTFMSTMVESYGSSYVGVAGMGGSTVSYANNRLGGYLAEVQPTIQVLGNQQKIVTKINGLARSASGLLLEPAVLDMGDNLSPFAQQSGSIVLLIKLGTITGKGQMNVETDAVHLLNSRSIRLVTLEIGTENVLRRVTELTNGTYFTGTLSSYQTQVTTAFNAVFGYLDASPNYANRRVQLVKSPFTTRIFSNVSRYDGYTFIDWANSGLELNFFIPIAATGVTIIVQDNRNMQYTPVQTYLSWNGQYRVYTVTATLKPTGYWKYSILSSGTNPLSGFVDVVEVLPNSAPVHIGGGGLPSTKPVEFEVYTSGNNGVLTMSSVPEDQSMIIYVAGKKGYSNLVGLQKAVATIRQSSTGNSDMINLKDDGIYPDMVCSDGIYTGYYRPPADGIYNISVNVERTTQEAPNATKSLISGSDSPMSYSMSIDQTEFCCGTYNKGPSVEASFQRQLTYAASVQVSEVTLYSDRPTRIMDLRVVASMTDPTKVTLTWTTPASTYGSSVPVDRYQLVYSPIPSSIINEEGLIPAGAVEVSPSDVLVGSLTPLAPRLSQTVTIRVQRVPAEMPPPLYFTIGSISNATQRMMASFPSPMQYLIGSAATEPLPSTPSTPSSTTMRIPTTTPWYTSTTTTPTSTVTTQTSTTTRITTTTLASTTRTSTNLVVSTESPSEFVCPVPYGYYAIPGAVCSTRYLQCSASVAYYHNCATRTVWNNKIQTCDWPTNVPGC